MFYSYVSKEHIVLGIGTLVALDLDKIHLKSFQDTSFSVSFN